MNGTAIFSQVRATGALLRFLEKSKVVYDAMDDQARLPLLAIKIASK